MSCSSTSKTGMPDQRRGDAVEIRSGRRVGGVGSSHRRLVASGPIERTTLVVQLLEVMFFHSPSNTFKTNDPGGCIWTSEKLWKLLVFLLGHGSLRLIRVALISQFLSSRSGSVENLSIGQSIPVLGLEKTTCLEPQPQIIWLLQSTENGPCF